MKSKNVKWHKISADAAVTELHTNAACGLSHKAARSRVRKLGANTLFDFPIPKKSSVWNSFLTDPAILMLLFTLLLALVFSFSASVLLSCIVCVCAFACTFRLTGRFTSLWRTVTLHRIPTVSVLREGKICEISARGVVLGDILLLGRGDIVPCDCRLLKTTGNLRTRLFFGDENGKRMALEQIKQADFVYPYEDQTFSPNYVNMLYGKSEVLEGEARAVAVATGDYTFMGALGQSTEAVSEASNCMCSAASVERFIRTCSAVLTALLIPLCFVGFFTSPKEYDVLQIFLPLCALCGVCARSVLSFFFQAIIADGYRKCATMNDGLDTGSVLKEVGALEKLADIGDVLVIGKGASSDGVMHVYRAAVGGEEIDLSLEHHPALRPLCEVYELLWQSYSVLPAYTCASIQDIELFNPILREELRRISRFDIKALEIRTQHISLTYRDAFFVDVTYHNEKVRYCVATKAEAAQRCTYYEKDGKLCPMNREMRDFVQRFIASVRVEGGELTVILRSSAQGMVLMGLLSCRQKYQPFLPSVLEELRQSGVRVGFFLSDEGEQTANYIREAKLPSAVLFANDLSDEADLLKYYAKYRVFVGFSDQTIKKLVRAIRGQKRKVAVISSDADAASIQSDANLRLACSPDLFSGKHVQASASGTSHSRRALKYHAHMILPTANLSGGGLCSYLHAVSVSRAVQIRMCILFRFLLSANLMRVVVSILSVLFGIGTMSATQILLCGWIFDLLAVFYVLSSKIPQNALRARNMFDGKACKKIMGEKPVWLSPCLVGVWICSTALLLSLTCGMDAAQIKTYVFLSVLPMQCALLFFALYSNNILQNPQKDACFVAVIVGLPLAGLVFSLLIPTLQSVTALVSMPVWGYLALIVNPVFYFGVFRIIQKIASSKTGKNTD